MGQFALTFDSKNTATSRYMAMFVVPSVRFELTLHGF